MIFIAPIQKHEISIYHNILAILTLNKSYEHCLKTKTYDKPNFARKCESDNVHRKRLDNIK